MIHNFFTEVKNYVFLTGVKNYIFFDRCQIGTMYFLTDIKNYVFLTHVKNYLFFDRCQKLCIFEKKMSEYTIMYIVFLDF